MTTKQVRLTKKRLAALDTALSLDDILYEKFRRLMQELHQREAALYKAKRIIKIIQKRDKLYVVLQILEVHPSEEGTTVICQ
jgi:hypothetical protein